MNWCMRTNVVLNDELVEEARKYSTAHIEEALRVLVQTRAAEQRRARYERELLRIRRRLEGVTLRESAHDIIRRDRDRA